MTKRILVTGAQGFVAPYVVAALRSTVPRAEVLLTSRAGGTSALLGDIEPMDVTETVAVATAIRKFEPTHVINLAGLAAIPTAMAKPEAAWQIHLNGARNIAAAILQFVPNCVLLNIGTGQVYGATARAGRLLDEDALLAPTNSYTASKAAADLALGALVEGAGLRCIRLRPFNHTGPNQSQDFVVPDFAMQVARIAAGLQDAVIKVGVLDAKRDFLDVRDVATAYVRALERADDLPTGTILNVASGIPQRIGDILERLIQMSGMRIRIEEERGRYRSGDIPLFVGEATKARQMLDWTPIHTFDETLRGIFDWACLVVRKQPPVG